MIEKYSDADAIITIEGKEYALYKNGPLKKYPYMIDISTGGIPQGEQRPLLRTYLLLNGVDIEPWEERGPHWCVRQAIKVAQGTISGSISNYLSVSRKPRRTHKKAYLPITEENISDIHQQALADANYGANFAMIHDVLKRFPQNTDRELVAMKVSLIDLTNSTNISRHINKISLSEIVKLILSIHDFDIRLSQGDPELVGQLARSNGKVNLFSFASKYCTYHSVEVYEQDDYSIFDSVVKDALPYYVPGLTKSLVGEWRATYNYHAFNHCIGELLDQKDIHIPFRRRKFDHFFVVRKSKKQYVRLEK